MIDFRSFKNKELFFIMKKTIITVRTLQFIVIIKYATRNFGFKNNNIVRFVV